MNLANKITLARVGLIPLFIIFLQPYPTWMIEKYSVIQYLNSYGALWAFGIFVLAASTDKLDGYIARKYNQITNLGKLLDPLADKLLISIALIMLVQGQQISTWIAIVVIGREILINGIRILAAAKGIALAADRYGKLKLVFQVIAIAAVLLNTYLQSLIGGFPVAGILMSVAVFLTLYSGYNYIKNNYEKL